MTMMTTKMTSDNSADPARPDWSSISLGDVTRHPRILIASDFDGTLSPIVERPEEASLADSMREVLEGLVSLEPRVTLMLVSGRSLADLRTRTGIGNAILAGNHGLEILQESEPWVHPQVVAARQELDDLLHEMDTRLIGIPGIELEDKGLSITVHYRRMNPQFTSLLEETLDSIPLPSGVRRHGGKMVHEFRPAVNWHKGLAVREVAARLGIPHEAVVFLGDDLTDEDAFRELGPEATTLHVGDATKPSLARYNASAPDDVETFLRSLLAGLGGKPG